MVEMLDIYDDNWTHLGSKPRPDVHRDGDWHRVFHCWVIFRDSRCEDWVIVQRRGTDKATFPDYLDVSAAGHYAAGETVRDGVRELQEELGLPVSYDDLHFVGQRPSEANYAGLIDREVADVHFHVCDQPLSAYQYQREELSGLLAIPVSEGLRLFRGEVHSIQVPAVGLGSEFVTIRTTDFIPTDDQYFHRILLLARRHLSAEKMDPSELLQGARFCPKCGLRTIPHLHTVADRVRDRCPACAFVDYAPTKIGVGALVFRGEAVLLVNRNMAHPFWTIPSGHVERGERLPEAVVREVREETGLQVEAQDLVLVRNMDEDGKNDIYAVFICHELDVLNGHDQENAREEPTADGDESLDAKFIHPDDFPSLHLEDFSRWLVEEYRKQPFTALPLIAVDGYEHAVVYANFTL